MDRRTPAFILSAVFVAAAASVLCTECSAHDAWTEADSAREGAFLALDLADLGQTRYIARHPEQFYEVNPLIGRHPSVGRVDAVFAGEALAHVAISYTLPERFRPAWQYGSIAFEGALVAHNAHIGIRFNF